MRGSRGGLGRLYGAAAATIATTLIVTLAVLTVLAMREGASRVESFGEYRPPRPSRMYAQPVVLEQGQALGAAEAVAILRSLDYREVPLQDAPSVDEGLHSATFRVEGGSLVLRRPTTLLPGVDPVPSAEISVGFDDGKIASLTLDGRSVEQALVEYPLLASFYPPETRDCWPVEDLNHLPGHLLYAVLAAEDESFVFHEGISLRGIARAAWSNLRTGRTRQGGSTITQQLAKNLYLTHERSYRRKAREAILAWALDRRLSKSEILTAYLNEVYLGTDNGINLIGIGSASRYYFGKPASDLTVGESALLAGMIASPGRFHPIYAPESAIARRDHVLRRMQQLGWITSDVATAATRQRVALRLRGPGARRAPYFVAYAAQEARVRFSLERLEGDGYTLWSTLDWLSQLRAESAVSDRVVELERGLERRSSTDDHPIQAALVDLDARDGAIRAYVGGRDHGISSFDRLRQARRQAGSTFKPIVYAAAIQSGVAYPHELISDSPVMVVYGKDVWEPSNYDQEYRGAVTVRRAMESSLNIPTIRLAAATGFDRIRDLAREMGVSSVDEAFPALALGAVDVAPLEMATVYSVLAARGIRHPTHALLRVQAASGEPIAGAPLARPRRVLDIDTVELVTSLLQGVIDRGTGYGVRRLGLHDDLAGKTGTSGDNRDSWFVGYSASRVSLGWVGYDDNARTRLTGADGALPLWAHYMKANRPAAGYPEFPAPQRLLEIQVDPETGLVATQRCPGTRSEWIPSWQMPPEPCEHFGHDGWLQASSGFETITVDGARPEPHQRDRGVLLAARSPLPLIDALPEVLTVSRYGRLDR